MKKGFLFFTMLVIAGILIACSNDQTNEVEDDDGELKELEVDFDVPESADPGDTIELKASVTYGDEPVSDADEVLFEVWESGHQDDGEKIEAENQEDGTYTLEYTFEEEAVYEMYAHTTAEGLHTMPKKEIIVGDAEAEEKEDESADENDHEEAHFHTEGFDMQFDDSATFSADDEGELTTDITMDEEALEALNVRYEIWPSEDEDDIEWVDAEEVDTGEYTGNYTFPESGTYDIQIHVKDDDDLHEHIIETIEVE